MPNKFQEKICWEDLFMVEFLKEKKSFFFHCEQKKMKIYLKIFVFI